MSGPTGSSGRTAPESGDAGPLHQPDDEHFYARLMGLGTRDPMRLHEQVEEGLSYGALERLRKVLDVPTSRFAQLLRIPPRTLARRRESRKLQPDESDRLVRLSRIVGLALRLFEGRVDEARAWLLRPHGALGDRGPLEAATTEIGAREVEHVIGRLEHGIPL